MKIPDFIAAAGALGLNARQAMDRLGVRSLSGLDLREALETLHRHMLHDESTEAIATTPPSTAAAISPAPPRGAPSSASARPASTASTAKAVAHANLPQYFEEEEDDDITFALAEEDEMSAEDGAPGQAATSPSADEDIDDDNIDDDGAGTSLPSDDDLDLLEDVPDFDEMALPASAPASAPPRPTPPRPAPRASVAERANPRPTAAPTSGPLTAPGHSRALQRIGQLRAVVGGAPVTPYQRTAFKNAVVSQLSDTEASALVRGLWRRSPAQLSGDHLDALVRWAKEDTFDEEAHLVLEALAAERERAAHSAETASTPDDPGPAGPAPLRRPSAARGTPAEDR